MMDNILAYIRSWFPEWASHPTRKRKLSTESWSRTPKFPRLLSTIEDSRIEDDIFSTPLRCTPRSSPLDIHNNYDEDFVKPHRPSQISSDESMYYRGNWSPTEENKTSQANFTHISRYQTKHEPVTPNLHSSYSMPMQTSLTRSRAKSRQSLDYSIRLDDKRRYEQLLEKVSPHYTSPTRFQTPKKQTRVAIVDLTHEAPKKRLSTKEVVFKIVEESDNEEAVSVEDSDSEVEVIPNPPSPKPDFQVDPINSLRTVVDTSEVSKPQWLKEFSRNHHRYVEDKAREIQLYNEKSTELNDINRDIQIQTITRRVQDALKIHSILLPEIEIDDEETEFPELSGDYIKLIKYAFTGNPNEVLSNKFNLSLKRLEVLSLDGLEWLNDNVINFYMNLIMERSSNNPNYPKTYCTNTFFYERLRNDSRDLSKSMLLRWTRKVDIFTHDVMCVPIHLGMHWCMAIIYFKEKIIRYYDSMGHSNNDCLNALKNYLEYEHLDKKKTPLNTKDFILENMKNIPQQMNGSDCGVFACCFAEYASRGKRFTFQQEHMPYMRKKMVVEIMLGRLLVT